MEKFDTYAVPNNGLVLSTDTPDNEYYFNGQYADAKEYFGINVRKPKKIS